MEIEKYSKELLSVITNCLNEMIVNDDIKSMMNFVCETLTKITKNQYGFIGEMLKNKKGIPFLRYRAIVGNDFMTTYTEYYKKHFIKEDNLDFYNFDTLVGLVYTENKIIYSNDLDKDPRRGGHSKIPEGHPKIKNFIGIPLSHGGEIIGIIGLANYEKKYDDNYIEYVKPFIPLITSIIVNYRKKISLIQQRDLFLANMSHEVRTPLNGIVGMGQFLMDTKLTNDQQEMVNIINKCSLQLLSFINDLLDFSKMVDGNIKFDQKVFDLEETLQSAIELFQLEIEDRKIKVKIHYDAKMPKKIINDKQRILQIIVNLTSNAVKFTTGGTIEIGIDLVKFLPNDVVSFQLTIKDNGCGIPAHRLEEIQKKLKEQENLQFPYNLATGLGLPISKFLVDKMQGTLSLKSKEKIGTTAVVNLETNYENLNENSSLMGIKDKLAGQQVLLICDDMAQRLALVQIIIGVGMLPLPASTIEEAHTFIENGNTQFKITIIIANTLGNIHNIFSTTIEDKINKNNILANHHQQLYQFIMSYHDNQTNPSLVLMINPKIDYDFKIFDLIPSQYRITYHETDKIKDMLVHELNGKSKLNKLVDYKEKVDFDTIRILSVEDNYSNQRVLAKMLNEMGFTGIKCLYDGIEFIEDLEKGNMYDIVLIDLRMPRMDGKEAVQKIIKKGLKKKMIFIALTATVTDETMKECFRIGMDAFIEKPINLGRLKNVIQLIFKKKFSDE